MQDIVALVESAYRGDSSRSGWTTEADLLDGQRTDVAEVEALIAATASRVVIARRAGDLVACVCLKSAAEHVYVGMLAVQPRLQGHGLGRALLTEVENIVRREYLPPKLRMTVIAQRSELIAYYERCGYRRTGEREAFPYGEPRFGLPRRADLYFEVLEKPL
ncbi:MAG TPA: GNAT family N-acetyltransferase [Polyangiaceae bacterium]|nr:GNAT family N-acetyltransferase [Polyangiaceae bacterium]